MIFRFCFILTMMSSAVMTAAAAMFSAGMIAFMMMVIALNIGIKLEITCQKGFNGKIGFSGGSAVDLNANSRQCCFCSAAYAAADKNIYSKEVKDFCQSAMAAAVGA